MQYLVEKFVVKVAGWKKKLFSQGGRLILIPHILSSIPLHVLAAMDPPKAVLKQFDKIIADFFWGESEVGPRRWRDLCYPIVENGLGLRSFSECKWHLATSYGGGLGTQIPCGLALCSPSMALPMRDISLLKFGGGCSLHKI